MLSRSKTYQPSLFVRRRLFHPEIGNTMSHTPLTSSLYYRVTRGAPRRRLGGLRQLPRTLGRTHGKKQRSRRARSPRPRSEGSVQYLGGHQEGHDPTITRAVQFLGYRLRDHAAIDWIRQLARSDRDVASGGSSTQSLLEQVAATELPHDLAADPVPAADLIRLVVENLTFFIREKYEEPAQLSRECILTYLQATDDAGRQSLLEHLIKEAEELAIEDFGTEAITTVRLNFEERSWRAFLLVGLLELRAKALAPWLGQGADALRKSVHRVDKALSMT